MPPLDFLNRQRHLGEYTRRTLDVCARLVTRQFTHLFLVIVDECSLHHLLRTGECNLHRTDGVTPQSLESNRHVDKSHLTHISDTICLLEIKSRTNIVYEIIR